MKVVKKPDERFQCPRCGGSSFGSVLLDPTKPATSSMRRCCHGDDAKDGAPGCEFTWKDEDDWKYFLVDGKKLTHAEYRVLQERNRLITIEGIPQPPGVVLTGELRWVVRPRRREDKGGNRESR